MEAFIEVIPLIIMLVGFVGILIWHEVTEYLWRKQFGGKNRWQS